MDKRDRMLRRMDRYERMIRGLHDPFHRIRSRSIVSENNRRGVSQDRAEEYLARMLYAWLRLTQGDSGINAARAPRRQQRCCESDGR